MNNISLDNQENFELFIKEFNQLNVKNTVNLFNYMKINQPFNKNEIKHYTSEELYSFLNGYFNTGAVELLRGENHDFIKYGPLGYNEDLLKDFAYLKFSLAYPKYPNFPSYEQLKETLIKKIKDICDKDSPMPFSHEASEYYSYVFTNIRHILNYCIPLDKEFKDINLEMHGLKIKEDINNANLYKYINKLLKSYLDNYQDKELCKEINNLSNFLSIGYSPSPIKIPVFGSHQKGQLGEEIYSTLNNSEVVGYKNNKIDLIQDGQGISLKSSYSSSWNNHLAYLNEKNDSLLISALKKRESLSKLPIDWFDSLNKFITNNEDITELVFQKIIIDEITTAPKSIKIWRFNVEQLTDIIKNKNFIFTSNSLILYHEQEQVMKIAFKKRTNNIQVLILTDEDSLNNAVNNNLGTYDVPIKNSKKNKM